MIRCQPYVLSCALLAAPLVFAAGPKTLGSALTLQEVTPIATILATPAEFEGRRVQVQGKVTSVCEMKGCWMLVADPEGRELRVKVADDGPLVFPQDAPGRTATVEGTVQRITMTREQYLRWQKHLAEEQGASFDEAKVGAGPFERVELAGLAARLD